MRWRILPSFDASPPIHSNSKIPRTKQKTPSRRSIVGTVGDVSEMHHRVRGLGPCEAQNNTSSASSLMAMACAAANARLSQRPCCPGASQDPRHLRKLPRRSEINCVPPEITATGPGHRCAKARDQWSSSSRRQGRCLWACLLCARGGVRWTPRIQGCL